MNDHEFRGESPAPATERGLKPGTAVPETGSYACASCADTVAAAVLVLEKDQQLPLCHTCGPLGAWVKQP